MNQCKDEIAEIASKTIPGINNYEDYYNWTAEKRGSLAFINECYEKIYTNVAEAALSPNDPSEEVAEILMAHILREEYCKAIVEARLNNPDKPFAECLSHEQIMTIYNKRNLMKNEIQDKIGRLYAGNHEALIEALPSLITGGSLSGKNIEVELTNGEVKIKNAPTKEEVTRRSLYLKADKQSAAERFSAIFTEAEEAQINVHLGSKEYDRAQEALKDVRDRFGEGDEIRSGMPQDMESYKAQVKKIADTQEFKDIMADKFDRKELKKLLTDKRATKELLEEFREKTKPARKRSNSIAGKNPVKNDGENKDGKEGIIKRSNSMKIGK